MPRYRGRDPMFRHRRHEDERADWRPAFAVDRSQHSVSRDL